MKTSNAAKLFARQVIKTAKKKKGIPKKAVFKKPVEKGEDYITMLRTRIKRLEQELRMTQKARQDEININRQKIEALYSSLDNLKERINQLIEIKTSRQKKVEELEKKIKAKAKRGIYPAPPPVKPFVRHAMKFGMPAPKKPIPAEEEIKPELPSLPRVPEVFKEPRITEEPEIPRVRLPLPPKPRKKTFSEKLKIVLFGKPKPKF